MEKDLTLVILAAGMGSRYGGLKQIEPIGPNGEFIIDYSIYDAIQAGFKKVVFIIKKENYEIFKETIGHRVEKHIDVSYCFQDINDVPKGISIPKDRTKPWGTGHAVLAARHVVHGNFVMINSDDFYGRDAYMKIKEFFDKSHDQNGYSMVAFRVVNTMTENGSVKRGICEAKDNHLTNIIESNIEKINDDIVASPLDGRPPFTVNQHDLVSMNFFGFTESMFETLEKGLTIFLKNNQKDLSKCEYLIPNVVFEEIKKDKTVTVLESKDKWLGVTYKEDKDFVVTAVRDLIKEGKYPEKLWK